MRPAFRRNFFFLAAVALIVALMIVFPRVQAFVELAGRELRFLWWLILIAAVGFYLAFFAGRKRDDDQ